MLKHHSRQITSFAIKNRNFKEDEAALALLEGKYSTIKGLSLIQKSPFKGFKSVRKRLHNSFFLLTFETITPGVMLYRTNNLFI